MEGIVYPDDNHENATILLSECTLAGWLLGDEGQVDDWAVRRNICLGVANGIHYWHTEARGRMSRLSINLHTIFLDTNLNLKIGGVLGECSLPEPGSEEEDVYNYGVVLLEIVSRRIVRKLDWPQSTWSFCDFWGEENIDPALHFQPKWTKKMEAMKFLKISLLCIDSDTLTRPDMACVVAMLQGNLDEWINQRFSQLRERFASQAAASALVLASSHHGRNSGCDVPPERHGRNSGCDVPPERHTRHIPPNNLWGSNIHTDPFLSFLRSREFSDPLAGIPRPREFPDSRPPGGMWPCVTPRCDMFGPGPGGSMY